MDAPIVSVGQQLRESLSTPAAPQGDGSAFEPTKVTVPQPNTGFAALDNPSEVSPTDTSQVESNQTVSAPPPRVAIDPDARMSKVMAQAQKVQADRQAMAQERATLAADLKELAQWRELKARSAEDPVGVAEAFGYEPDKYATSLIEKGTLTPEKRKLLEQAKELQELKQWRQEQTTQQQQAKTQALYSTVQSEMQQFAQANAEQFDLVSRTKSFDRVLFHINEHYRQTTALGEPEVMPYEEAFNRTEQELEQFYAPVLESPKFRSKLASAAAVLPSSPPSSSWSGSAARKPAGTINSKMRAQSAPPKELSEAERLQRAGDIFLNQITKVRG